MCTAENYIFCHYTQFLSTARQYASLFPLIASIVTSCREYLIMLKSTLDRQQGGRRFTIGRFTCGQAGGSVYKCYRKEIVHNSLNCLKYIKSATSCFNIKDRL